MAALVSLPAVPTPTCFRHPGSAGSSSGPAPCSCRHGPGSSAPSPPGACGQEGQTGWWTPERRKQVTGGGGGCHPYTDRQVGAGGPPAGFPCFVLHERGDGPSFYDATKLTFPIASSQAAAASRGERGRVHQRSVRQPLPRHEGGRPPAGFRKSRFLGWWFPLVSVPAAHVPALVFIKPSWRAHKEHACSVPVFTL